MNRASDKPLIIPYRAARHFQQGNQFLSFGRASAATRRELFFLNYPIRSIVQAGKERD